MFDEAVSVASQSDVALLFVGLSMEGTPSTTQVEPYTHIAIEKEVE